MVRQAHVNSDSGDNEVQSTARTAEEVVPTSVEGHTSPDITDRVRSPRASPRTTTSWSHRAWSAWQLYCVYFATLILGGLLVGHENWHAAAKTYDKWIAKDPDTHVLDVVSETGTVIVRTIVMAYGCYALLRDGWIPI